MTNTGATDRSGGTDHQSSFLDQNRFRSGPGLAGLLLVGLVFVVLAALTWRKWPDLIIDFGTQLYIPWRLDAGAVLYRDLYYFAGGPLSQYFNALLFKIFGVSFSTLIAANLTFSCLLLGYVYRRFLAVSDTLTATMMCLAIVIIFTFSGYAVAGNYNYIAPYSHETVHGLLLSLLAVGWLSDWLVHQKLRFALLPGLCAGMVLLTKPDIFVALLATVAAALALHCLTRRTFAIVLKSATVFAPALLLAPLFFFLFFLRVEDWRTSCQSVLFGWLPLFHPEIANNPYYRRFTGMDSPLAHLHEMGMHFLCAALAIGLYAILFRRLARFKSGLIQSPWIYWLLLVAPLFIWAFGFQWLRCGSSLPLWCAAILAVLWWQRDKLPDLASFSFPFLWTVFALVLMAKMGLFARIWHYGFALAMPALVICIYFLLWLLPRWLQNQFAVPAKYLRAAFVPVMVIAFALLLMDSEKIYAKKQEAVGQGGDTIIAFGPTVEPGDAVNVALKWMATNAPAGATLSVLPCGVTLNYLSRRVNPTPCLFWDPNVLAMFGQDNITTSFKNHPPDFIMLVEQDHTEFGVGYFGTFPGYGVELMRWIRRNYRPVVLVGDEPLTDGRFGIKIFQHVLPNPTR